jgi:hypothetical protein
LNFSDAMISRWWLAVSCKPQATSLKQLNNRTIEQLNNQ